MQMRTIRMSILALMPRQFRGAKLDLPDSVASYPYEHRRVYLKYQSEDPFMSSLSSYNYQEPEVSASFHYSLIFLDFHGLNL